MGLLEKLRETKAFFDNIESVEEQTISEVVLEAAGITISLPTEEKTKEFYTEIGDPNNVLTTINPKDWTSVQFINYQRDVKTSQAKNRFKNIKNALKLKKEKNKEKQKKERKQFKLDFITEIFQSIQKNLEENVPDDQKPEGVQKLGNIAGNITKILAKTCLPSIFNMIEQAALDTFEAKKLEVREELGIDESLEQLSALTDPVKLQEVKDKLCPTPDVLENLIQQRNGIVSFLNNQQEKINSLKELADSTGDAADFIQDTTVAIELSALIANQLAKVPGANLFPGFSVARSLITDLQTISQTLKFDIEGSPRIPPLRGAVSNFSVPLNQANTMITKIVQALAPLDEIITLCSPNATLENLSLDVLSTLAVTLSAESTDSGSLYKGFRLKIEERPYTDTVTQSRAVGVNESGIVLIASEFSFASNPNVLINEIKFIIDRDNLKAY